MLENKWNLTAYHNFQFGYVIDTEKGVYVDSRTMSREQYTKYYRTETNNKRPDLNFRQSTEFARKYWFGEQLLNLKKHQYPSCKC